MPLRMLSLQLALFNDSNQLRSPHGPGPAAAKAQHGLRSWGSQAELGEGSVTGLALSQSLPASPVLTGKSEARTAGSSLRKDVLLVARSWKKPYFGWLFSGSQLAHANVVGLKEI